MSDIICVSECVDLCVSFLIIIIINLLTGKGTIGSEMMKEEELRRKRA